MNNTIVLFNRPIWVSKEDGDIRTLVEIYGFLVNQEGKDINHKDLEDYLDYLCGTSKWYQHGNSIIDFLWISNSGEERYCFINTYIKNYIKEAREQMHLTYLIFETNKILDKNNPGELDGEFIISRDLYNNIMEYGVIVK